MNESLDSLRFITRRTLHSVGLGVALGFAGCQSAGPNVSSNLASSNVDAASDQDLRYLTLSAKNAALLTQAMRQEGVKGELQVLERNGDVVVAELKGVSTAELSGVMHDKTHRCSGFIAHNDRAGALSALRRSTLQKDSATQELIAYTIDNQAGADTLIGSLSATRIVDLIRHLSSYTNRYYRTPTGIEASNWIKNHWQSLIGTRTDASVELFTHASWPQSSVILTVVGETLPNEVVVIGGHLDSTAGFSPGNSTVAPGADDDASGIATLTEVARAVLSSGYRPQRTLKFIGYAAEEVGLRGSQEIVSRFLQQGVQVVGALQLDMTGYYDGGADDIVLISDYTTQTQNAFLGQLIDRYVQVPWGYMTCDYACSDHASWFDRGVPVSFPFETQDYNSQIHSARDTLENMDATGAHELKFGKLAAAYVAELAKGGTQTNPDPRPLTAQYAGLVQGNKWRQLGSLAVRGGSQLSVQLQGAQNVDLVVRFGAEPDAQQFDCRPNAPNSDERCLLTVPAGGAEVFIAVFGNQTARYQVDVTYFAR